jgi:phospholipid-binding lipoprotein MlaA
MQLRRVAPILVILASAQLAAGPCQAASDPSDPFEPVNRRFYAIEHALEHTVLGVIVYAYMKLPKVVRRAIANVSSNVGEPVVFANDMLQGHPRTAGRTAARFLLNSTMGVGGLFDLAKRAGVPHHDNDLGITLGRWGAQPGPYIYLPMVGPTTFRDGIGALAEFAFDPLTYANFPGRRTVQLGTGVAGDLSLRIDAGEALQTVDETSTDPYATLRSYYLQNREAQIHGGGPAGIGQLPSFDDTSMPDITSSPPPSSGPSTGVPALPDIETSEPPVTGPQTNAPSSAPSTGPSSNTPPLPDIETSEPPVTGPPSASPPAAPPAKPAPAPEPSAPRGPQSP